MSAGKKSEVTCQSGGSRPPAVVTWWLGSKRLQHVSEEIASHENLTISVVHFTPAAEDNGKILSCRSDHSILPDSALEDSYLLDVYCKQKKLLSKRGALVVTEIRINHRVSELSSIITDLDLLSNKYHQHFLINYIDLNMRSLVNIQSFPFSFQVSVFFFSQTKHSEKI